MCLPEDMLPSRWNTIQKRFEQYTEKEKEKARITSWATYKLCLNAFNEPPQLISNEVRYAMRDLSRFFAEPLELDVSRLETIYRRNCWLSFVLIAPITAVAFIDLFGSATHVVDGKIGAGKMGLTVLAGILGGTLSAILRPSAVATPLYGEPWFLRPVLGAVTGLILWLLGAASVIQVGPFVYYLIAISAGFSDGFLAKFLSQASEKISHRAIQTIGHDIR